MENAVKALLIVAGVLIGVMILALGTSLYSSLTQYVEQTQQEIINRETQKFNEQFLKYINWDGTSPDVDFVLTLQDIITAANAARENNLGYGLEEPASNNYYVTVNIVSELANLEDTIDLNSSGQLLESELAQYKYICTNDDIKVNQITGRVYEVNFTKVIP